MKRGDLVTVTRKGARDKAVPAVVIQSGLFEEHPSIVIAPITTELRDTPLFRLTIRPDAGNGLEHPSQIMVDKIQSVSRERIGPVFGRVGDDTLLQVNRALAVFLGLA